MSEVMSQSEIDALLSAVSSGDLDFEEMKEEDPSKKAKKYDFRNPQKISKEQLRTLEVMHENFGRYMQTFLTGYLRTTVEVDILTVDQFAYNEFSNAISTPAFLAIVNFHPLNGQMLFEIANNVIFTAIDKLTGGDGKEEGTFKTYTEIEIELLSNMMNKLMVDYARSWENVIELNPLLDKIEVNPQFAQIAPPNETIVLITMELKIGGSDGLLNICLPYILLEPIIDKLNTRFWFSGSRDKDLEKSKEVITDRIKRTKVPVVAELGNTVITINEFLNLNIGDVLRLDTNEKSDINIRVGSNVKFKGSIGTSQVEDSDKEQMAVQIIDVMKEGEWSNE